MPVTRVWLWLAAAAALALTSGKAHGEAAAGWGDREILFSVKSDRGSFNPAVACDSDNDCLVAFTNKGKRLKYKFRPAGGSWGDFVNALDPSTKQEQVQVAVYGKNKGWVLSFRDATINESGERLHSIKVAYITKDDASAGSAWTGSSKSVPLQVSQAFNDNSANRLPTIAADDENNVVLVWETSSEHTLGDDINIGSDKDLVSVSFTISNGSPIQESDLTEATTVFSGVETDSFQDRNPIIFKSPHDQRLVVGSTASMAGGVADIFVSETEVDVCAWNDRLRITNFDGKDADVTLAASPHKDLWLAAWEHKGVGIRYARLQHNENDKLSVESLGFIAEIAFPYMQGDEQVVLVADPMRDLHWAVFYRYRTAKESPRKYRLVFRVSKDDGQTWSDAYYADSEASSDYGRIAPVALASPLDEYMVVVHGSENVFSLNTTGTALFNIAANSASQRVPVVDYEEPGTSYSCLAVELPQNGTSLDLGDIIGSVVPSMVRCIEIAVPDATPDSAIHLNLELRFDIELMEEYLGPCPFNFIGIREDNALNSGDFSLADSGILPRRLCAAQRYEDIRVAAGSLFVFMNSGERGLSGENQGAKPLALEAWMTPGRTGLPSDTENPAFEVRAASSFEELRDHLQDDTFVHGRVTITSNYLSIARELVIRQKTNISLVADEGMDVYFHGDDILHVERGAVLWLLRGITFSRQLPGIDAVQLGDEYSDDGDIDDEIKKEEEEEEEDDVQQRFGGLVFVEGRVGRIESCAFLDSEPTGSLGMRVGGGLLVDGTVDVIHSTTFDNMKATQGGAMAVTVHGHVSTIQDSIFVRNRQYKIQAGVGGAIAVFGTIGTIAGSTFQENHCNSGGGAIAVEDGGAIDRILDTDFVGNDADLYGGAVQFNAGSQMPSLWRGGMLLNNRALGGAAVYVTGALASPQVYGSCETGAVCFQNLGVEGNVGVSGGAFFFDENPSIDFFQIANMSFTNNSVSLGSGGAVLASGATMISVSWSNFALNQAHASGGAVALDAGAQMDFQEVTFDSNMAQGQGGALYAGAGSSTTVRKASFLNNAASYTCREYTVCNLKRVTGNRMPCEASNGMVAVLDEAGEAPMSLGCTKGVGGSIYLAAGVTAHIHQCNFAASNPLPSIDAEASYSDAIGNTKRFAAEAGKHVYAASRFRLSETSFDGGADAFAPSTAVIGCPKTCSSSGTCSRDGQVSPSVACTCAGAFEGDNGYDEGGCTQRRVKDVRASSFAFNETTSSDGDANGDGDGGAAAADGSAQVSWTWAYEDVDYFVVYRTADRSSTLASSDEWASCASVEEASTLVSDCIKIEDPFARSAALGLRFNVSSFFRVIAVVNGQESAQSDPMSSASIICDAGSEQIPTLEDGVFTCEECPRGTFVQNSEVGCLPCPNELQTTLGVATSEEDCLAPRGFYQITAIDDDGQEEVQVLPCGEGILCTAPGLTLDKLVLEPGFWPSSSIYIIAMLLFLVFPSVNTTIVQTFVCDTFEDGSRALRFDYTTDCDERDWVFWYAVLMVLVYQVGPIVLFVMLIAQSDKPTLQGASFLYEFYDEQTKDSKQGCFRFRRYYEVFELVRKLLLTSVVLVVADGTLAQVAFALCVTFFAALVQTLVRPYSQGLDNVLATVVHAQLFLLLSGLLISSVVQNLFAFRVSMAVMLCLSVPLALFIVCKRLREGQRQPMQDLGQGAQSEIQDGAIMLHGQEAARRSNEGEDGGNAEGRAGFSYVIGNESRPAFYVEKQRGSIWGSFEEEDKQHDSAAPVVGATLLFDPCNSSSDCRSTVTMATTGSDQDTSVVTESVELVDARTCSLTLQ
ncbi:Hypothetical Protein FCC1311_110142 [Hondaea fermentalgiana]|uniref:Tyrosine-protein kinase ephrin type A/B receptor-like domain-containing protein n=1 Tax=Hondaea fermentalgiana TaxID=2315210 RepID=A0A2R5GVB1_9STRA|nr:Hypothetical Protein FCC1311_110142 [Hondaea fermentalgiana]|eukprot:GBG34792.1 Hypothetical Protein FCC1311_110142 [Hondaea fermentalgiana]